MDAPAEDDNNVEQFRCITVKDADQGIYLFF